jgi:2-oxoacid:acceptor oxidoreductase gamma subunit (pyruvate/2-ketoisovalerate family)
LLLGKIKAHMEGSRRKGLQMIEIKFLGRGGQGVVLASQMLARACFEEGLYPQSFSIFGGERRGAPVAAFVRVDKEKIYLKCDIEQADHLVLFDSAFLDDERLTGRIKPSGSVLANITGPMPPAKKGVVISRIDALEISMKHGLGAIINTAMLGAYAAFSGLVQMDTLIAVMRESLPTAIDRNLAAAKEAFERTHRRIEEREHLHGE